MKKYSVLLLLAAALVLNSCSSAIKTQRSDDQPDAPAPLGSEENISKAEAPASQPADAPAQAPSRSQQSDLVKAIESNNTRQIKEAALAVLERDPRHVQALNALAMAHFQEGNMSLAQMMLERALQVEKKAGVYNNLGVIYLKQNNEKEAIRVFREAIKLDARNATAAANIGAIYVKNRDYKKALTVLRMAHDNGNRELSTIHNYAVALTANGDANRAESFYETVIEKSPNSTEALTNYSIFLIDHKKDYKKGLEAINKLRFIGIPAQVRDEIRRLEEKANTELNKG